MAAAATPDLITVQAAADMIGCSHWTLRRRIADGALPAYRFGHRILRVDRADVLALGRPIPTASAR